MNEDIQEIQPKKRLSPPFLYILIALLVWALGSTRVAVYFGHKYSDLQSDISNAGDNELLELIKQKDDTILSLRGDLSAAIEYGRAADERAEHAEGVIDRAYAIVEQSDAEFAELRNTVANTGGTIQEAIKLQQGIIDFVARGERNNTAIKMELGMRP